MPLSYDFGQFHVDAEERVLSSYSKPIPLPPKVFDTLLVLLENQGHILTKKALMDAIWPESFVEEVNLAHNISVLRKVFGESPNNGKFIETVPKRGYRFVCELKPRVEDPQTKGTTHISSSSELSEALRGPTIDWKQQCGNQQDRFWTAPKLKFVVVILVIGSFVAAIGLAYLRFTARETTLSSVTPSPISSIAVLPFANESGDPNYDYLSDGLSESLIDRLALIHQLKVIARESSSKYRGSTLDLHAVADSLDVQAIVIGRVAKSGDNLIIRTELVDAVENRQLWSENYNRQVTDLQATQVEIAQKVSEKLRMRLTGVQEMRLARNEVVNPEAYESFLKGRFAFYKGGYSKESLSHAIEYFENAIAIEPNYALAYSDLSSVYRFMGGNGMVDPKMATPLAEEAARKAVELDANLAEGYVALANLRRNGWQWEEAEEDYKSAIDLNPSLLAAHSGYAQLLSFTGRHEQAIAEARRARELDPLTAAVNSNLAQILYFARRYDEALEAAKRAIEIDQKEKSYSYYILGDVYFVKGMYREAIDAHLKGCTIPGYSLNEEIYIGAIYAKAGNRTRALASLEKLQRSKQYIAPGELAIIYAALGEREQAFALLEKAYAEHDLHLIYLGVNPYFDRLRDDPRFADLMQRIGLLN